MTVHESEARRKNPSFRIAGTLRYVIIDPKIESVFGSVVLLNNVDGTFEYRAYSVVLEERRIPLILPWSYLKSTSPERAELRDYAVSCFIATADSPIDGLAYHYVAGKVTYMYWGQKGQLLSNARVFSGMNIDEFFEATKQELGVGWFGTLSLRKLPPAEYGRNVRWQVSAKTSGPYRQPG